jgi:hypothetical protein
VVGLRRVLRHSGRVKEAFVHTFIRAVLVTVLASGVSAAFAQGWSGGLWNRPDAGTEQPATQGWTGGFWKHPDVGVLLLASPPAKSAAKPANATKNVSQQ